MRITTPVKTGGESAVLGQGMIQNLSKDGAFIETSLPFDQGAQIAFEVVLDPAKLHLRVSGVVRWISTTEPRGVGVELTEIRAAPEEQSQLYKFIEYVDEVRNLRKERS